MKSAVEEKPNFSVKAPRRKIRRTKQDVVFDTVNIAFTLIITFIMTYPLWYIVIMSFSSATAAASGKVYFWPIDATLEAYQNVIKEDRIWRGYANTILYTIGSTCYNLVLMIPAAYVLSKKYLRFRGVISWYFFITMYFGGGLIPSYLLNKALGLVNSPLIMVLGTGIACSNLIVTRTFFQTSIPGELYESAYIDGASEFRCFVRITLPLSGAILAVMSLYNIVGVWGNFYTALIYLTNQNYWPLQMVLRQILILNETAVLNLGEMNEEEKALALHQAELVYTMKYAIIFIASAPLLCIYPFVQKYFVKGVMIGSVKG